MLEQPIKFINYSLAGVMEWLASEYKKFDNRNPLTTALVSNPTALRQVSTQLNSPDKEKGPSKIAYPYILYSVGDISLDETNNGFNKKQLSNIVISKNKDAGSYLRGNLRPVKLGLGLTFNADNFDTIINLAHVQLMNAPIKSFVMEREDGWKVGFTVELDPSFTMPTANFDTPGSAFQFSAIYVIHTYIGTISEKRLIRNIKLSIKEAQSSVDATTGVFEGPDELLFKRVINYTDYLNKAKLYGDA